MTNRHVRTVDDLFTLLDGLFDGVRAWTQTRGAGWDAFYRDRDRPVPFFRAAPDESLADWTGRRLLPPAGRALDVGCGPGRNALWLGQQGWQVDGLDLSAEAVGWAGERLAELDADSRERVRFEVADALARPAPEPGGYDLVVDSGCLHHLPPHRRISYLAMLERLLVPGWAFALTCFAAGATGSQVPDADLYRTGDLGGGLAFSPGDLTGIFRHLDVVEIRPMRPHPDDGALFGTDFLLVGLFRRPA